MPIDFMTCNLLSLPLSHSLALTAQQWPSRSSFQTWQPEQNSQKIGGRTLSLLEQRSARHVLGTLAFTIPSFAVSAATVDRQFWYSKHYVLYIYYILYIIYYILYIIYYISYIIIYSILSILYIIYIIYYILYIIYYILYIIYYILYIIYYILYIIYYIIIYVAQNGILCRFHHLSGACQKATALFGKEAENAANLLSASSIIKQFLPIKSRELSHFHGIIMGCFHIFPQFCFCSGPPKWWSIRASSWVSKHAIDFGILVFLLGF